MNIRIAFLILFIFTSINASAQNPERLRADIEVLAEKIHLIDKYTSLKDVVLDVWNDSLRLKLQQLAKVEKNFLENSHKTWKEHGLYEVSSPDKKFKIVYWNDQWGGTLREHERLIFYRTKEGIQFRSVQDSFAPFRIRQYKSKKLGVFYIVESVGHGSNRMKISLVKAYAVKGTLLNKKIRPFRTKHQILREISVRLDMMEVKDSNDFIHFSEDGKSIFVPVVYKNRKVEHGTYLVYRYDGNRFIYKYTK